jgi:chorismate mutase
MSLPLQLKYVTTASRMYCVEVSRLRTLWNSCGLVSVHETTVIWSLHCCVAIIIHLTESWQTVGLPFVPMVIYST